MADPNYLLPRVLKAYRYGETLPLKLDRPSIIELTNNLDKSVAAGMPKIGKDQVANKILLEGRTDAGVNNYNYNNRQATALLKQLTDSGLSDLGATYAAAVLDKSQVAARLHIPFEMAWNGTGRNKDTGRTGADHAIRAKQMQGAASDPRNAELLDLIQRSASDNLTPRERLLYMNDDYLTKAMLNIDPQTPRGSDKIDIAASDRIHKAIQKMTSTDSGMKAYAALNKSRDNSGDITPDATYVTSLLGMAYKQAVGVEPDQTKLSPSKQKVMDSPEFKVMLGLDPGAKQFLTAAEKQYPPEPGILDKIVAFFTQGKP